MAGNRQAGLVLLLVLACLITVVGAGGPEDVPRSPPLAPAPSAVETRRDHWYTLELGDRPVGWMHRRRVHGADHSEGGAFVRTERRTHLQLVRGGTNVAIDTTATFVESPDGDPRSATARTRTGEALTQLQWRFTDDSILERREEDGRVATRERTMPERPWLTPAAADVLVAGRIEAGARRIEWGTLDPEAGLAAVWITMEADGRERVEIRGRPVAATRWRVRSSASPTLETVQLRSRDGHLLVETTETALGRLRARLATREQAIAAAAAAEPAEVMRPAMIEPRGRLDRRWQRIRYAIRRTGADADPDEAARPPVPAGGPQRVRPGEDGAGEGDGGWWRVTVDPAAREPGEAPPVPADLAVTAMIDAGDEAVRRLAGRAIEGAGSGAAARAEAMRRLVHEHIDRKELDRLFDSASRAARSRQGDCSEHAVLLAAMLRSAGIPARIALGLVDAEDVDGRGRVFAWHMWTRAWTGDRWVDLDATRRRPFGPTHLRVAESAGEDGALLGRLTELLASVGRLEIRVLGGDR